ncbi:branched-chain amino acid aminotransferase [Streptomyces sp. NPDC127098]|uniref:branched-chain amino acid aminotransferase n=1 Tax=Streptomyces sp. NPDC127098 TaxID=3347137 RepID=UPI00364EE1E8
MTTPITFDLKPSTQPLSEAERAAAMAEPGFGRYFTDHMVTIRYTEGRGWHDATLQPYAPIPLDPATMALHYGQEIFEGLKAYRQPDGSVVTFRPDANARRFQRSARRLGMPELPVETFVEAIDVLVAQDAAWVPSGAGQTLYLRPFMFATEVGLGINRPANEYLFMVIASPAGDYFAGGVKPVSVWLSNEYVRAAPGGTGEAKCAGNYAAAFLAQAEAVRHGCDQVVWLDAVERRFVEEMGSSNLYFVRGSGSEARIYTPELTGTLLPGITRDSLLTIAADLGYPTEEFRITVDDWRRESESGAITEVFACGTASVITPVGSVKSSDGAWTIADGQAGQITLGLREALVDIQTGRAEDRHGWLHRVA